MITANDVGVGGLPGQAGPLGNGGNGLVLITAFAPCAAGSYFSTATSSCVLCAAGTYASVTGGILSSSCLPCLGYTSSAVGATVCSFSNPIIGTPFAASYTGVNQNYVVPQNVSIILVQLWGGGGGGGTPNHVGAFTSYGGGAAGYTQCFLAVGPSMQLNVIVGGGGLSAPLGVVAAGGFGGGGQGQPGDGGWSLGGGGGRSATQIGYLGIFNDVVTAGAGGGGGGSNSGVSQQDGGGAGGGLVGIASPSASSSLGGNGGSQTAGGVGFPGSWGNGNQGTKYAGGVTTAGSSRNTFGPGGGRYCTVAFNFIIIAIILLN